MPKSVLPKALPGRVGGWSARTKRLYEGWRGDPITGTFGPSEVAQVIELAYLQEAVADTASGANEVRLRMDGLGLTPKGKRDLRFNRAVRHRERSRPARPASSTRRRPRAVE
jgi:hypothetical protein